MYSFSFNVNVWVPALWERNEDCLNPFLPPLSASWHWCHRCDKIRVCPTFYMYSVPSFLHTVNDQKLHEWSHGPGNGFYMCSVDYLLPSFFFSRSPFSYLHPCGRVRVCSKVLGGGPSYGEGCVLTSPGECPFHYLHWWDWCYCYQEVRRSDWRYELMYTKLMFPTIMYILHIIVSPY